ncbi:hypothetical protein SPRG_11003 [Saprolegnia parasitica CBS 223.65]|uniref:E2F-associated phosphoprotein n=1 Tax=Saprolegnia parasitica (strain CBS 223.65) TaxID=695850 RepID=A0A067BWR6_SAPPC|nr:hypothetical protein SPRG_11003 [Saprolegnia parasitica CBS 223.65]KDO22688.1 hypothetical protein SPRG_11003 [Saprolegnia parasitica CBS 223.65]|eukprot:XP_012206603.1 hypothetical protein SPRG_11003 [Saprolegnia parasitica CBS 223.65]
MAAFNDKVAELLAALDRVDLSREAGTLAADYERPMRFDNPASPTPEPATSADEAMPCDAPKHPGDDLDSDVSDDENAPPVPDELYGETLDDEDEAYVQDNLRGTSDAPKDAALSCPCCFLVVCYASQRHDRYETQYRSEKPVNCRVQKETVYYYEQNKLQTSRAGSNDEAYYAVVCSDCETIVGVKPVTTAPGQPAYTHFFQVLPSHI